MTQDDTVNTTSNKLVENQMFRNAEIMVGCVNMTKKGMVWSGAEKNVGHGCYCLLSSRDGTVVKSLNNSLVAVESVLSTSERQTFHTRVAMCEP